MSVDFRICPWLVQRGRTLGEDIEPRDSIFAERNHQTGPFTLARRAWPGNQGGSDGMMRLIGRGEKRKDSSWRVAESCGKAPAITFRFV